MGLLRPATPGFILTLTATILLAIVSFDVPWIKSVYFLKASLSVENINGSITFGTLGYCYELSNGTTCSSPSVGYQLDINSLVGNTTNISIPTVIVKWLTYALVLHIVALILSAISSLFGLLAHVREMAMTCFSTCVSGFAATVALLAFIFDLAFFFVAKSRIDDVQGGQASMGNAIWLTLAAWLLLFFSGCFFGIGRCCIRRRPRGWGGAHDKDGSGSGVNDRDEQLRLDAVKAEADRKERQKRGEGGLPAFNEHDPTQPLKAYVEGDSVYTDEHLPEQPYYDDNNGYAGGRRPSRSNGGSNFAGGYAPTPASQRAVDEYYNPTQPQPQPPNQYPPQPQPRRQGSGYTQHSQGPSVGYAPSTYGGAAGYANAASQAGYANAAPQAGYATAAPQAGYTTTPPQTQGGYYAAGGYDPYAQGTAYGHAHGPGGSTHHAQESTGGYDPYAAPPLPTATPFTAPSHTPSPHPFQQPPYHPAHTPTPPAPDRSYTLGGGGYGTNVVPILSPHSPPHSPVRGPRDQQRRGSVVSPAPMQMGMGAGGGEYDDSPPVYEEMQEGSGSGAVHPQGGWAGDRKR